MLYDQMDTDVLALIDKNLQVSDINFSDEAWLDAIPSEAGWYFFSTNTPVETFKSIELPAQKNHYSLIDRTKTCLAHRYYGICLLPKEDPFYFVYANETHDLQARIQEHIFGSKQTRCLALATYPVLHEYDWRLHFSVCDLGSTAHDSKWLRICGKKAWRSANGWPILCKK